MIMEGEPSILPISVDELPAVIRHPLSEIQKRLLSFGMENFKIIGLPLVKTIPAISLNEGQPTRRIDIQIQLEGETTHKKILLDEIFPIEKVLSAELGDLFTIFYVRGEDYDLIDKSFIRWKAIAARNHRNNELIHWEHVPVVISPRLPRVKQFKHPLLRRLIAILVTILLSLSLAGFLYWRFNPSNESLFFKQQGTSFPGGASGGYYIPFGGGGGGGDEGDGGDGGGDGGGGD